jgi:hypothetical protein
MPKRSRLAEEKSPVRFSNGKKQNGGHLKTGPKFCPANDHLNTGRSGFRMLTVHSKLYKNLCPVFEWYAILLY